MGSTERLTFLRGAVEFLQLGLLLGVSHAVVEISWLGWYGVALERGDFPLLLILYGGAGMMLSLLLWAVLYIISGVGILQSVREPAAARLWFLACAMPAYGIAGSYIIGRLSGVKPGLAYLGIFLAIALLLLVRFRNRCSASEGILLALFAMTVLVFPLSLYAHEKMGVPPESQTALLIRLLWPGVLFFLAVLFFPRRGLQSGTLRPLWRAFVPLFLILIVALLLWTTIWPLHLRWHVHRDSTARAAERTDRPDILLLILDTLRADHMELFGYQRETSPNLTRFGREECALAMEMAATAPSSLPSHGSMFTGMFASMHGGHKQFLDDEKPPIYGYFVRDDVPTLPGAMAELGYHSVGLSANYLLRSYGLGRGFTYYDVVAGSRFLAENLVWINAFRYHGRSVGRELEKRLPRSISGTTLCFDRHEPTYRRAREMNRLTARWFDEHPDEPVFMMLNLFDVHAPYVPVPEFDQYFAPEPPGLDWVGFPDERYLKYLLGKESFTEAEIRYMAGQYDAELLYMDREIGYLFDHLKKIGRYDEMMIIVLSDHGESFLEHGFLDHSATLYQPQVSVPLLVKMPLSWSGELPEGEVPFQFVDIFPTVMHVVGGETPDNVEGSVWAAGRDYTLSELYCQFCRFSRISRDRPELNREIFAVTVDGRKIIVSPQSGVEHYDLLADPEERADLAGSDPELEERAISIIEERLRTQFDPRAGGLSDSDFVDQLRSLGYVQ